MLLEFPQSYACVMCVLFMYVCTCVHMYNVCVVHVCVCVCICVHVYMCVQKGKGKDKQRYNAYRNYRHFLHHSKMYLCGVSTACTTNATAPEKVPCLLGKTVSG